VQPKRRRTSEETVPDVIFAIIKSRLGFEKNIK
jgi:hypothetical protein